MNKQKVILITGASSGMGKVTAQDLIKAGHIVYAVARRVEQMQDLAELGGYVLKLDVTQEAEIQTVVEQIIAEQGRIDVLWNNAGYGLYGPVEDLGMDKVQDQFEVNVFGVARLTKQVLPYMRERKEGLIINTSSMGGKIYTPLGAWYHASKHAIEGYSDCLRLELAPFNIKVVVLEPGLINTGFNQAVNDHFSHESQNGPYKDAVAAYSRALANPPMKGSDPSLISKTVQKIINARRPKTRYLVGQGARLLVIFRRLLGDRIYDALMFSQMR